jgi:hypothetical protein
MRLPSPSYFAATTQLLGCDFGIRNPLIGIPYQFCTPAVAMYPTLLVASAISLVVLQDAEVTPKQ